MAKAHGNRGFTLIELVMALAIVAIASSFAVASYRGYLQRGHRVEAVQALMAAAAEQEKFHLAHGRYSDRLGAGGGEPGLPIAPSTPRGRYRITIERADVAAYRVTAELAQAQADPHCARLSIDESGRRYARDGDGADSTARCW